MRLRLLARPCAGALCFGLFVTCSTPAPAQTVTAEAVEAESAKAPERPSRSPFADLFAGAARDFRRLASRDSIAVLSVGSFAATVAHSNDQAASQAMSGASALEGVFGAGQTIGGARMQAAAAVAALTLGWATSNERVTDLGVDLVRAQLMTQLMTGAIKTAVGRTRPDGEQFSFPSGHSAVTFASATVLQRHFGWKAGVPAYAVAGYVAASRVQVRRHFLSDVAFGAALGIVAGRTVTIGRGDRRFALAPAVVPGGAGVSVTLLQPR